MSSLNKLIFIVGNSRSGTTMLGRILGQNSQVHTFEELHFFEHQISVRDTLDKPVWDEERRFALLERLLTSSRSGFFSKVIPRKYRHVAQEIDRAVKTKNAIACYEQFLHYEAKQHGKSIPCEQTPRYLFFAKEILEIFPDAIVVNMARDPRDVLLSQKNKWRRRFLGAKNIPFKEAIRAWGNYHPWIISRLWLSSVRAARQLDGHERFLSIKFEDLVQMPEKTVRHLCEYIDVPFEVEMLSIPQIGSSTGQDKPDQKGIDVSRFQAWKKGALSRVEIYICQQVAGAEMRRLGYDVEYIKKPNLKYMGVMAMLILKGGMALLMNLGRTKNLSDTLKRRFNLGK